MAANMIGRVIAGRYQITERIGIGGMAEVYRAQDNVLGRLVAVKVMLPQYAEDAAFAARFKQEASAVANLQSPYIVNVYDWGQDSGDYYIVMEFVRGSDLKTAINERGRINQRKVAEIGSQVCQALSVAHGQDIIHRDIKPQNIMVQPDGNVKVMDFGIARAKNSVKTQTSSVLGTAHYISPEQAQGKDLTAASDIYSLGIVLYEAACGQLPFDGPDAVSVALKQVNEIPAAPSTVYPEISPDLEAIIMKALEKNPENRFATAQEMKTALNAYLSGRPVSGVQGASDEQTRVMRPTPVVAPITSTMVMDPVNNGAARAASRNYQSEVHNSEAKRKRIAIVVAVLAALAVIAVVAVVLLGGNGAAKAVEVPDVVGMTQAKATETLQEAGFVVEATSKDSDTVDEGKIISQSPEAGQQVEEGSTVQIVVSGGVEMVKVPDLSELSAEEAQEALKEVGLEPKAGASQYSDSVDKGLVVGQDIAAETEVAKGSVVTYYLSLGVEPISIPDVSGKSQAAATSALQNAGFNVSVESSYSDSIEQGIVISQSPLGGNTAKKGDTVTITVSKGPENKTVSVPNVKGYAEADATSALQDAGFYVDVYYEYNNDVEKGTVISQNPVGGNKVDYGSQVSIYVSNGPSQSSNPDDNSGDTSDTDTSGDTSDTDTSGDTSDTDTSGDTDNQN